MKLPGSLFHGYVQHEAGDTSAAYYLQPINIEAVVDQPFDDDESLRCGRLASLA
jgi:hypothetical protein